MEVNGAVRTHEQHPQLEGEGVRPLFADLGQPCPASKLPAYHVVEVEPPSPGSSRLVLRLRAGMLHGVTEGSQYRIFAPDKDIIDPSQRLAEMKINKVDPDFAEGFLLPEFAGKVTRTALQSSHAVEVEHYYGQQRLKLYLADRQAFAGALRGIGTLETQNVTNDTCDVRLEQQDGDLVLTRRNGALLRVPNTAEGQEQLKKALLGEWRWQFLANLENRSDLYGVEVRLTPAEPVRDASGTVKGITRKALRHTVGRAPRLSPGETFVLEVRNTSREPAFLSILALHRDGTIEPLLPSPDPRVSSQANKHRFANNGQWQTVPLGFKFDHPDEVMIKAFVTRTEVNLNTLAYYPPGDPRTTAACGQSPLADSCRTNSPAKRAATLPWARPIGPPFSSSIA